jgi:hypothetical protein
MKTIKGHDSIFTKFFYDGKKALELYNALARTDYDHDVKIQVDVFSDAFPGCRINDISFIVDDRYLVTLIECRAGVSITMPTMALMNYQYLFQKNTGSSFDDLFYPGPGRRKLKDMLAPRFIVLYTGDDDISDKEILKLSDSYDDDEWGTDHLIEKTKGDLIVPVYNINKGRNKALMKRSPALSEYSSFMTIVNDNKKKLDHNQIVEVTIQQCIDENILRDLLLKDRYDARRILYKDQEMENLLRLIIAKCIKKGESDAEAKILGLLRQNRSLKEIETALASNEFEATIQ